ncbi:MAG: endonuclease III [Clostridia bacterium]|nr:endonuclease III [Clostridia bacterium]
MIDKVMDFLAELFPNPDPELHFENEFQCLVAVVLSAQCTDKRVNEVTKVLFKMCPDSISMARLSQSELEKLIYSTGFYHNKAKNILALCKVLNEEYGGKVPTDPDVLETLPGVGRKTANVVSSACFGANRLGVDTHVFRVTNRLGLVKATTPLAVEKQWTKKYAKYCNHDSHFRLVLFGRYVCKAQNPKCGECKLSGECKYFKGKKNVCRQSKDKCKGR